MLTTESLFYVDEIMLENGMTKKINWKIFDIEVDIFSITFNHQFDSLSTSWYRCLF